MSRTTRLDPRTNDPYINKEGKLELASDDEELFQKFDILVHTRVGTLPFNIGYGIDHDWIGKQIFMSREDAFLIELINRIEKKVEPVIKNFEINDIIAVGENLHLDITLRGENGMSGRTTMTI